MRVLVDTSVWVDHFRAYDGTLAGLLWQEQVLCHPLVIGEVAWGLMAQRDVIVHLLRGLPRAPGVDEVRVRSFVDRYAIAPDVVGPVGLHLLASVDMTEDTVLWTWDPDLDAIAESLNLAYRVEQPGQTA